MNCYYVLCVFLRAFYVFRYSILLKILCTIIMLLIQTRKTKHRDLRNLPKITDQPGAVGRRRILFYRTSFSRPLSIVRVLTRKWYLAFASEHYICPPVDTESIDKFEIWNDLVEWYKCKSVLGPSMHRTSRKWR